MHELAIMQSIVDMAEETACGRAVRVVTLEIGALSGVSCEALAFCFELVTEGTVLNGAALDIREIPGRHRCAQCGAEFAATSLAAACACGSLRLELVAGGELNLKSLEVEEAA